MKKLQTTLMKAAVFALLAAPIVIEPFKDIYP